MRYYCPKCGTEIPENARFCSNCNFELPSKQSRPTSVPPVQNSSGTQRRAQNQTQNHTQSYGTSSAGSGRGYSPYVPSAQTRTSVSRGSTDPHATVSDSGRGVVSSSRTTDRPLTAQPLAPGVRQDARSKAVSGRNRVTVIVLSVIAAVLLCAIIFVSILIIRDKGADKTSKTKTADVVYSAEIKHKELAQTAMIAAAFNGSDMVL